MASTSKPTKNKKKASETRKTTEKAHHNPSASTSTATDLKQQEGRKPGLGSPPLEPWMRQTVVLKLKEMDGKTPDMSQDVFGKKMVLDQGFGKPEVVSIHSFFTGIFWITFASVEICKRYWEMVKTASPDSPFRRFVGSSPVRKEERRDTVSMRNPHIPGKDIVTLLNRFCTVVRDPTHILDGNGFWTGKWSVIVRLNRDSTDPDGVQHLPQTFSLGNSSALVYYPDMPQNCRRCGKKGHGIRDCKEVACWICRVAGHDTKECPRRTACNLCGSSDHIYKDCPKRERTWAAIAAGAPARKNPTSAQAPAVTKPKEKKPSKKQEGKLASAPAHTPVASLSRPTSRPVITTTEEIQIHLPITTVAPSTAPCPTLLTVTTAAAITAPPAAVALSMEEFPPLASPDVSQRKGKRKGRDSPVADHSKKKMVEVAEQSLPDKNEEEMEQQVEDPVATNEAPDQQNLHTTESLDNTGAEEPVASESTTDPDQLRRVIAEIEADIQLLQRPLVDSGQEEEKPPDVRSGN